VGVARRRSARPPRCRCPPRARGGDRRSTSGSPMCPPMMSPTCRPDRHGGGRTARRRLRGTQGPGTQTPLSTGSRRPQGSIVHSAGCPQVRDRGWHSMTRNRQAGLAVARAEPPGRRRRAILGGAGVIERRRG
jgi:hypothetical protein